MGAKGQAGGCNAQAGRRDGCGSGARPQLVRGAANGPCPAPLQWQRASMRAAAPCRFIRDPRKSQTCRRQLTAHRCLGCGLHLLLGPQWSRQTAPSGLHCRPRGHGGGGLHSRAVGRGGQGAVETGGTSRVQPGQRVCPMLPAQQINQQSRASLPASRAPACLLALTVENVRQRPALVAQGRHHGANLRWVHNCSHARRRLVQQPGVVVGEAGHALNLQNA